MTEFRDTLFGDLPLTMWGANGIGEPWARFKLAAARLAKGDRAEAVAALQAVLARADLESRHYLEAWMALRAAGVMPPDDQAKRVLGVVLDVPMPGGVDTLAAYADRHARYLNYSGAAIVWEAPDARLDPQIHALLKTGQTLANLIGPWDGARPPLNEGRARISLLTPSGLHFGDGPFEMFMQDPNAGPVLQAGTELMRALIGLQEMTGA
jgi:hypothetical protein